MRTAHGIVVPPVFGFDARWTVKDRHTRLPTEQEVAEINAKHLISTPIKPAHLLFVFGTREDVARRVIYSVESKSSSFALNIPDSVRSAVSSWSSGGAANASRTPFGACPGLTANVVDGVNAISRRAAAATKVCDRQCGGNVSHR